LSPCRIKEFQVSGFKFQVAGHFCGRQIFSAVRRGIFIEPETIKPQAPSGRHI